MGAAGLRARKMARTRGQIAEAALSAFAARGYDATTLDEIADAADVHKRTLLRYFPTKAHLVLHGHYAAVEAFRVALATRGPALAIDVWQAHVVAHARSIARRGPLANTRKLAATEPAVRLAYMEIQTEYQQMLAQALAAEWGVDPARDVRSKVAAAALSAGNFAVSAMVLGREAYAELERAELQVIALVRERLLCGDLAVGPKRKMSLSGA